MNGAVVERPSPSLDEPGNRLIAGGVVEEACTFECHGETLFGVLSMPAAHIPPTGTAVVIIIGGPQYRAGAHRQFVQLARALANDGHGVLRFDHRGAGDSGGAPRHFEDIADDIHAAIRTLQTRLPSIRRTVLFGLCDGASAALLGLGRRPDIRVDGLCLLNPWVRSAATLARTHMKHYYVQRLIAPTFWRKLFAGGVGLRQGLDFLQSWRLSRSAGRSGTTREAPTFQQAMASSWRTFSGRVLLLLSEDDLTAREFLEHSQTSPAWQGLVERPQVERVTLAGADHTLSAPESLLACEQAVRRWLAGWTNASSTGASR